MMPRKDLFVAALAGAGLSLIGCLLLAPRGTTRSVPEQEAVTETSKAIGRVAKPPVISVGTRSLQVSPTAAAHRVDAYVRPVPRPAKPAHAFQTPELLPVPVPAGENSASTPLAAPQAAATPAQPLPVPQTSDAGSPARVITAQEARAALGEVGSNPEAEAVWIAAINDPNLPANQRKDLIEDLNEEGFADPKHLTASDLPRIESRLTLIEDLAPQAIDQTNADAFQEAYKDLKNMHDRLNKP